MRKLICFTLIGYMFNLFSQPTGVNMDHPFVKFLEPFIATISKKERQLNQLLWILETTGAKDASDLRAELDEEYRLLFHDKEIYQKLLEWKKNTQLQDPYLKRQLDVLIFRFKQNMIPKDVLQKISIIEADISLTYTRFRPTLDGKPISENEIRTILKESDDPQYRKKTWELSKEIGTKLAPKILEVVHLRNEGAKALGYPDYFQMQLALQEMDPNYLFKTLEDLYHTSEKAYQKVIDEIENRQKKRFSVNKEELGPWSWSDPFSQEDPLDSQSLDLLYKDEDLVKFCKDFYSKMGFDITDILQRSDLYEREGKNQHAFCINIDRKKDVRTLNNLNQTIRWAETLMHELGHAIYELGYNDKLPWLLREPPHMITTEAMALICGRQVYLKPFINEMLGEKKNKKELIQIAHESLKRRQLIFSRWVMVMTYFEKELYHNPNQDLNTLFWNLVEKYQKVKPPLHRKGKHDWASKYHIAMAPVYYYSYLFGEMLASSMQKKVFELSGENKIFTLKGGEFFKKFLFSPGNAYSWDKLVEKMIGTPLSAEAWVDEFASIE